MRHNFVIVTCLSVDFSIVTIVSMEPKFLADHTYNFNCILNKVDVYKGYYIGMFAVFNAHILILLLTLFIILCHVYYVEFRF